MTNLKIPKWDLVFLWLFRQYDVNALDYALICDRGTSTPL